jgi:ATP-dependent Lhr-like helicase
VIALTLINDQFDRLSDVCRRLEIPVHKWHGDVLQSAKKRVLGAPDGVLLITPESLEALFVLRGGAVPVLLAGLSHVVVDELHSFIGTERGRHLQSLLNRVEVSAGRTIPRVAMSATLGDMSLAAEHLRPGKASDVVLVTPDDEGRELKLLVKGYLETAPIWNEGDAPPDEKMNQGEGGALDVATDMFSVLRGSNNLVFANSRGNVEFYADRMRQLCEDQRLPQEFWAHHGNLSREYREDAERALKDGDRPATVVCTTTLELGIDIGAVKSVAQVGAPPSVASLRQRLGRSGRRRDDPAILRFYVCERELTKTSAPEDALRVQLVQSIAMIRLLLQKWYEPPTAGLLHLSTLVQQVLSLVAERGGIIAEKAWELLCEAGPFRNVTRSRFGLLLRAMGENELIEQSRDGTLLLAAYGERIVNHYSFYAVFATPDEYRLVSGGKPLGTLPLVQPVLINSFLIFGGRRWRVVAVDDRQRVIDLVPSPGGRVPKFSGTPGLVHGRVREEMLALYRSADQPAYVDARARELLREAQENFARFELDRSCLLATGSDCRFFVWAGDRARNALQALLALRGFEVASVGLTLSIGKKTPEQVAGHLTELAALDDLDGAELASGVENQRVNKYDDFLPPKLLAADYAARELDPVGALRYLRLVASNGFWPPS